MEKTYTRFEHYSGDRTYQNEQLVEQALANSDFDQAATQGKGFCRLLDKAYIFQDEKLSEYSIVIYTLDEPGLLDSAAKREYVLSEHDEMIIHRMAVVRNGQYLDKADDVQIRILDHEEQGGRGFLTNRKKLSLIIKDLHLQDILIFENTLVSHAPQAGLKRDFKHVYQEFPDPFWFYDRYVLRTVNQTSQVMTYKSCFFRDAQHQVIDPIAIDLPIDESYVFEADNLTTDYDPKLEVRPFIDFATKASYSKVSDAAYQIYEKVISQNSTWLETSAPDLLVELAQHETLYEKIRFVIEFVQNSIYYVYDAEIMDGHEPQEPQITYESKQGDCKAKTVLLKSLLDYLDIASTCVLVNYEADYFIPFYCPSPSNFNHVILKIAYQGRHYFVDATSRNQFGFLQYRSVPEFMYYLPIEPQADLQFREPFWHQNYLVEETVTCMVTEGVGQIDHTLLLRGQNADAIRQMFKNESETYLFNCYTTSLYYNMCLTDNFSEKELSEYFTDSKIAIVSDNQDLNELQIQHDVTLLKPYTVRIGKKEYLNYWDRTYLDDKARDFNSRDLPFWLSHAREKLTFELRTDRKINDKEKVTLQECKIDSDFLCYQTTKAVDKHGARMTIDYSVKTNAAIKGEELANYLSSDKKIRDNNFGMTIDLFEQGFFDKLKKSFVKK